jgi:tetratricopeptide (TPR) repeat protein
VQREFQSNFDNMFIESLVRAVELRLDRVPAATAQENVKSLYRSGLLLLPYFYESLPTYEAGDNPFRDEIASMAAAIDVAKERARFESTFDTIPAPTQAIRKEVPVAPPAPVDPVLELLRTAEAAFERDKPKAREAFEKVLKEYNANDGRALYGIGLIEMDKANLDEALQYFERTIASDNADRSMKTWSYIYSGHILDFKCNRAAALEQYRKAIETGDNSRGAQSIAKRDMAQPFGGECQQ